MQWTIGNIDISIAKRHPVAEMYFVAVRDDLAEYIFWKNADRAPVAGEIEPVL